MLPYQGVAFQEVKTHVSFPRSFDQDVKEPTLQLVEQIQEEFGITGGFEMYRGLIVSVKGDGYITRYFQRKDPIKLGTLRKSAEDLSRPLLSLYPTIVYVDGEEHSRIVTSPNATARDLIRTMKTPIGSPYDPQKLGKEVDKLLREHEVRIVRPTESIDGKNTPVHLLLLETVGVTVGKDSNFRLGLEVGFSKQNLFADSENEKMPFEEAIRVHHKTLGQKPNITLTVRTFNNARTTIPAASKHKTIEELGDIRTKDGISQWPGSVVASYNQAMQRAVAHYGGEYL